MTSTSTSTTTIAAPSTAAAATAAASSSKTPKTGARARLQAQLHRSLGPPPPGPIRIVCVSDLHGAALPELPAGNILIVAGGLSSDGRPAQLQARLNSLAALASFAHVIVVAGASDRTLSPVCDLADTERFHDLSERLAVRAAFRRASTGAAACRSSGGGLFYISVFSLAADRQNRS